MRKEDAILRKGTDTYVYLVCLQDLQELAVEICVSSETTLENFKTIPWFRPVSTTALASI
jgi:hypothetical protein